RYVRSRASISSAVSLPSLFVSIFSRAAFKGGHFSSSAASRNPSLLVSYSSIAFLAAADGENDGASTRLLLAGVQPAASAIPVRASPIVMARIILVLVICR